MTLIITTTATEFAIGAVGFVWMLTPIVLVVITWWKWNRAGRPGDTSLLVGVSLVSLSCCELIPFWIPNTTRWEQLRIDVMSLGAFVSGGCSALALFILPFGDLKAKWYAFASGTLMLLFVIMFVASLAV